MFAGRLACPEPRGACPEGRRVPAFALRPTHASRRKNPLTLLFPLDSIHSPPTPLFPLDTRNIGGTPSPELRGTCPEPITNTVVTQQVSKVRRQLKYYLNCRHADILQWHSHSWLCPSQKPSLLPDRCSPTCPEPRGVAARRSSPNLRVLCVSVANSSSFSNQGFIARTACVDSGRRCPLRSNAYLFVAVTGRETHG